MMDLGSSPRLPAPSLGAANATHDDGIEIGIGAKQTRTRVQFDDSSSMKSGSATSIASSSDKSECRVCGLPEVLPAKPLLICKKCGKKWHQFCHKPDVWEIPQEFTCGKCSKKPSSPDNLNRQRPTGTTLNPKNATPKVLTNNSFATIPEEIKPSVHTHGHHSRDKPASKGSSKESKGSKTCEIPGCSIIIHAATPGRELLCFKHQIEERHRKAKAQPLPSAAPISKPIIKKKLYPVRPDDRLLLKRKRPELQKRSSASNEASVHPRSPNAPQPADAPNTADFTFTAPLATAKRVNSDNRGEWSITVPTGDNSSNNRNQLLSSTNMLDSPAGGPSMQHPRQRPEFPSTSSASKSVQPLDSAHAGPALRADTSPEYEPPPSQISDHSNAWSHEDGGGDSPGSQIAQELRANAEEYEATKERANAGPTHQSKSLPILVPGDGQNIMNADRVFSFTRAKNHLEVSVAAEDENLFDASTQALIDNLALQNPIPPSQDRNQPAAPSTTPLLSPTMSSDQRLGSNLEMNPDLLSRNVPEPETMEMSSAIPAERPLTCIEKKLARNDFDESVLDSFLAKQTNQEDPQRPTKADLNAQNWCTIDPRKFWPQRMTDEEIQAKIKQIEARGGRKANIGKIITAQNRQERAEKGWEIHQWNEKRSDEQTKEIVEHLEELLNVEGLANMVPATKNGRLVMMEREVPEEEPRGPGRRKRKNPPKVYPVHGAPNTS